MLTVALTGNVASGKSTVAEAWRAAGVPVVSADDLSRQASVPGSPALTEIRDAFGEAVFRPDGSLDRDRMRALIFRDPESRRRLEAILHPRIASLRDEWLDARRAEGHAIVVSEIPLLFEAHIEGDVDVIVVVDAPAEIRRDRLVRDRGIRPDEAERIMEAQGDPAGKAARADFVIENDGTPDDLAREAGRVLRELRSRAERA